jgi:hypothetical protein
MAIAGELRMPVMASVDALPLMLFRMARRFGRGRPLSGGRLSWQC